MVRSLADRTFQLRLQEAGVDGAVIVTTPQEVALQDVRKEVNFCKKVNLPILGVVENMAGFCCPHCPIFPRETKALIVLLRGRLLREWTIVSRIAVAVGWGSPASLNGKY